MRVGQEAAPGAGEAQGDLGGVAGRERVGALARVIVCSRVRWLWRTRTLSASVPAHRPEPLEQASVTLVVP